MHIIRKIRWIVFKWIAGNILFLCALGGVFFGLALISQASGWHTHSGVVIKAIDATREVFSDADTAGRLAAIGQNGFHLEEERKRVKEKLGELSRLVSDNPKQTENVRAVENSINQLFTEQDNSRGLARFIETENGKLLQIPVAQSVRSSEARNRVDAAFLSLRETESSLLVERNREQIAVRFRLAAALISILAAAIVFYNVSDYIAFRALTEVKYAGETVETETEELERLAEKKKRENGVSSIPPKLVEKLKNLKSVLEGTPTNGT